MVLPPEKVDSFGGLDLPPFHHLLRFRMLQREAKFLRKAQRVVNLLGAEDIPLELAGL
jgi:hypothetical protein